MPICILPDTFTPLLAAFQPCFTTPTYRNFCLLVSGWVHCHGRRTITAVAVAAGAVGSRHISVFHRFFGRAQWSLDAVGRVLFSLALVWVPADQPLLVWVDLALWVPLPMGGSRGFALPLLFRLYVGSRRGGRADARSRPRQGHRQR